MGEDGVTDLHMVMVMEKVEMLSLRLSLLVSIVVKLRIF